MFKKEAILNLLLGLIPLVAIGLLVAWMLMSKQADVDELQKRVDELQKGNKIIQEKK